jgi:hypothetical protein
MTITKSPNETKIIYSPREKVEEKIKEKIEKNDDIPKGMIRIAPGLYTFTKEEEERIDNEVRKELAKEYYAESQSPALSRSIKKYFRKLAETLEKLNK